MRLALGVSLIVLLALTACARLPTPQGWSGGVVVEDVTYRDDVYDRVLYIGTMEGDLRAVVVEDQVDSLNGGDLLWRYDLRGDEPKDLAIYGTPVITRDTIFFASYHGFLYSLSLDGEELWDTRVGEADHIVGGVTIADDVILVGSADGNLYAYDYDFETQDGSLRWKFPTGGQVWSTAAVHDGIVYFGSLDHNVYAVDLAEGRKIWQFGTGGAVTARPVVSGGNVLVGSFDSVFYAIDVNDGSENWRFDGAERWYWGGGVVNDDTVYAPSLDGNLYALDVDNGGLRWKLQTEGPILGSPVIVGDRIAVPSKDGGVYLVALRDGDFEDQCDLGPKLRASLTTHGDVIYLADSDHAVRELRVKPNGNLDAGWVHFTNAGQDEPEAGNWNCG